MTFPIDPVAVRRSLDPTPGLRSHPSIPIQDLIYHVESLKAENSSKLLLEYESIVSVDVKFSSDASSLDANKSKNRYANIVAYDHSRVHLQSVDRLLGSDYINANYIDGYRKRNAYIATQGPLADTSADLWRMIWEQGCATIVMMTTLKEGDQVKCHQYWPETGTENYGIISVSLIDSTELTTGTMRTFHLSKKTADGQNNSEKRQVKQFQFSTWPDHGIPEHPAPLLLFVIDVNNMMNHDSGPTVVHGSAGVGRTGSYIVIESMLKRLRNEETIDIYGYTTHIRRQRNHMVWTEEQYYLIHDVILEAVKNECVERESGKLTGHQLESKVHSLTSAPEDESTGSEMSILELPEEMFQRILAETIALEVQEMFLPRDDWSTASEDISVRLRPTCMRFNSSLSSPVIVPRVERLLQSLPPIKLQLNVVEERILNCVPIAVTTLSDSVYVIHSDTHFDVLLACNTSQPSERMKMFDIVRTGLSIKWNIAASQLDRCLYFLRRTVHATIIYRAEEPTKDTLSCASWITESVNLCSRMEISRTGELVLLRKGTLLNQAHIVIYDRQGTLSRKIEIKDIMTVYACGVLPTAIDEFIIVFKPMSATRLIRVNSSGEFVSSYKGSFGKALFVIDKSPRMIEISDDSNVRVLDRNFNSIDTEVPAAGWQHVYCCTYDRSSDSLVLLDCGTCLAGQRHAHTSAHLQKFLLKINKL